jgi:hypothetical protein
MIIRCDAAVCVGGGCREDDDVVSIRDENNRSILLLFLSVGLLIPIIHQTISVDSCPINNHDEGE